jgi:hypothetical protein
MELGYEENRVVNFIYSAICYYQPGTMRNLVFRNDQILLLSLLEFTVYWENMKTTEELTLVNFHSILHTGKSYH